MKKLELTGFQLKIIALVFMLLDHVNTHFGGMLGLPRGVHWLGRFVAPIFLYLLVEGFFHTRNRRAYTKRLFLGALVMLAINIIHNVLTKSYNHPITGDFDPFLLINGNNIFQTLTFFMLLFCQLDKVAKKSGVQKWLAVLLIVPIIFALIMSEGGLYLLPLGFVFYYTKNDKTKTSLALFGFSVLLLAKALLSYLGGANTYQTLYQYLTFDSEFMMVLAIPFIQLYNGQRGGSGAKWEKNLFYLFYPLHLVAIYLFEMIMKK